VEAALKLEEPISAQPAGQYEPAAPDTTLEQL
jgi:hypothetical protein